MPKYLFVILLGALPLSAFPLTLEEAWEQVRESSYDIQIAEAKVQAAKGAFVQASAMINPSFAAEIEGFCGNGSYQGMDSAENTFMLLQEFETGGKRKQRQCVAGALMQLALWELSLTEIEAFRNLAYAFIDTAVDKERLIIIEEQKKNAEEVQLLFEEKKKQGRASEYMLGLAKTANERMVVAVERAKVAYQSALEYLALQWGESCPDLSEISFAISCINEPNEQTICFCCHPEAKIAEAAALAAISQVALERAEAIPNVEIGAGYKKYNDVNERGLVVSLEIPLPIFNRNRGNIFRSSFNAKELSLKKKQVEHKLRARYLAAQREERAAFFEARSQIETTLPLAARAYENTFKGFDEGSINAQTLLDAENAYFISRLKALDALADYHRRQVDMQTFLRSFL